MGDQPITKNRVLNLDKINIPADTSVAEWIKEEAGTGASIESGSHKCPPICTDFILAHKANEIKPICSWALSTKFSHIAKYIKVSQSVVFDTR